MIRFALLPALILFTAFASSCASSGNPTAGRKDLIAQIKMGETTKEDIRRLFGQPTVTSRHSGTPFPAIAGFPAQSPNFEIWNYTHANVDVSPVTFVPIVGLFAGGATSQHNSLTLTFDDKGIVRNIQTGQSQATTGAGANTGQ